MQTTADRLEQVKKEENKYRDGQLAINWLINFFRRFDENSIRKLAGDMKRLQSILVFCLGVATISAQRYVSFFRQHRISSTQRRSTGILRKYFFFKKNQG